VDRPGAGYVAAVAANDDLSVDPAVMQGFAQSLHGGAEDLRRRLAELDAQVSEMLGGWRGASGSAYASAWELWHRGAGEVEVGLSMLARSIARAGSGYLQNETASARALRGVRGG
jgi:WXG100 family type VII secretion target